MDRIGTFLNQHANEIVSNLSDLVAVNTFARNKAGQDRTQLMLRDLMPAGYTLEIDRQSTCGDIFTYTYPAPGVRPVALHGHIDTLCPDDPTFNSASERNGRVYGPGAHDMKAGLVTLAWALRTLAHLGWLKRMPLIVIFNTDEETGSNLSKKHFLGLAERQAQLGVKFECAAMNNTLVTTRKGIARYMLTARGQSAHFGNLKTAKISAIQELGEKIRLVESFNRPDGQVAANVGKISGGVAGNVVAELAAMEFELRFWDAGIMRDTLADVRRRVLEPAVPGVRLELEETSLIAPWQPTPASRRIFEMACAVGRAMGLELAEEHRGGISDANWVAAAGIPAIDGFGPIGQGDCTREEFVVRDSLFQRIEFAVRFLAKFIDINELLSKVRF